MKQYERNLCYESLIRFQVYLNLTFESKVKAMICNLRCIIHTTSKKFDIFYSKANHRVLLNSLEPHIKEYVSKVEMVQRRAARHITNRYRNNSSVTSMLDHLEWESLEA